MRLEVLQNPMAKEKKRKKERNIIIVMPLPSKKVTTAIGAAALVFIGQVPFEVVKTILELVP